MDDEAEKFLGYETVMRKEICAETVQVKDKLKIKRKYDCLFFMLCTVTSACGPVADGLLNWSMY